MIDESILDEMDLPLANPNEELENISQNLFNPLFDVTLFELRPESVRDKGIDVNIEIKKNGKHTNFRFVVQLKATDTKSLNKDGSISIQIYTSNINYLLNGSNSAYYVLYLKEKNQFFYENLNDFVKNLSCKDADWQVQESHVLRFRKLLDERSITEIYNSTLKKGLFQREINERLAIMSAVVKTGDKILFDANLNVSDDQEIRRLIEGIGLELINEGKWNEILIVHKKASGNVASTAKYNLVLGIANYYYGHYFDALSYFKKANKLVSELSKELANHLYYFDTILKYSLNLISQDEYNVEMRKLEADKNIGLYIKIDKAKEKYLSIHDNQGNNKYGQFVKEIEDVINHPDANDNIKLIARCELILFEGLKTNTDYIQGVCIINAFELDIGPNLKMRVVAGDRLMQSKKTWMENAEALKKDSIRKKNYFAYYIALLNEIKVIYEFEVCTSVISVKQDIPSMPKQERPDNKPMFQKIINKLNEIIAFYNKIGHIDNFCAALSTKYEVQHFLKDFENANQTLNTLKTVVDNYDLSEHKRKLSILEKNGTTHQTFKILIDDILNKGINEEKE